MHDEWKGFKMKKRKGEDIQIGDAQQQGYGEDKPRTLGQKSTTTPSQPKSGPKGAGQNARMTALKGYARRVRGGHSGR